MRYLALIYGNEEIWGGLPPEEFRALVSRVDAFNRELTESGEMLMVDGMSGPATTIRSVDGAPVVSDGPYLEAKEHVGSMFVLDVESPERALEIARAYPGIAFAGGSGLELWPLMTRGAE